MKSFFKTYWTYFVSFIIPLVIMTGVYLTQGIYWNSDASPLLGDGFHQYVIFDVALRNILHGNGSLFYTFTSGLGLNFYALSSYYLGSFLSPLVYFFNLFWKAGFRRPLTVFTQIPFAPIPPPLFEPCLA